MPGALVTNSNTGAVVGTAADENTPGALQANAGILFNENGDYYPDLKWVVPIADTAPKIPDWAANARSWLGTDLVADYGNAVTYYNPDGSLAYTVQGQPTGYYFDNGKSQYVRLGADLGPNGQPVVLSTQDRQNFANTGLPLLLQFASLVGGPLAMAAQVYGGAKAIESGNFLGGLAALTGVGADVTGSSGLNDISRGLSTANAINTGNIPALIQSALSTDTGKELAKTTIDGVSVRDALQTVSATSNLINGNYGAALSQLGSLTGSSDAKIAGSAIAMYNALRSKNPIAIANAGRSLMDNTGMNQSQLDALQDEEEARIDAEIKAKATAANAAADAARAASVTGGGGLDTLNDIADTVMGGPGDDVVTAGDNSVTGGTGALDTVTITGSNGNNLITDGSLFVNPNVGGGGTDLGTVNVTGTNTVDTSGLNTTTLNPVTVTGTCPVGQHKDPVTGACVDDVGALDTVTVTGTCPVGQHKDPVTGACVDDVGALDTVTVASCPIGQHRDASGKCVPDELDPVTVTSCPIGKHRDLVTGLCVDDEVVDNSCPVGQHRDASGKCVPDELDPVTVTSCPIGKHRDLVTGLCVDDEVVDNSCPIGQHRDASGKCVPDTVVTPVVVTPPVVPPVTPTPTGGLPTYTDPTGIPGKVLTLGKMGNLMRYDEGLKQLDVPTMQHWSDMADMALPTADVSKALSALAQYAPDAEKDVIPSFYAHGGAVQHFADGAQPDVQAMLASYDKADVMDALKNLGNIGSEIKPANSRVLSLGQMGAASQQKPLQQMSVIPQLAALLQSRGMRLAEGGRADHEHPEYDGTPVFRTGGLEGLGGKYVEGKGDGTSDDITAMLANGEYVFSADVVSALGNGSNKAGAKELDHMVQAIRSRARSAPPDKLPPDAKSPLEYLKSSKGSKHG